MTEKEKYIYCKYCGARLKRDHVGQYCPTKNCQWQHGLPKEDDSPRKQNTLASFCSPERALDSEPNNAAPQVSSRTQMPGEQKSPGQRSAVAAPDAEPRIREELPLKCFAANGILNMTISKNVLKFATENCPSLWEQENDLPRFTVTDSSIFAKEIERVLNREQEDGSTMLSRLLDSAIIEAIDQGAEGVEELALDAARAPVKA